MRIVPFEPVHLTTLVLQDAQVWMGPMMTHAYGAALRDGGVCYTAIDGETVLACAGAVNMWENRIQLWALMSSESGPRFVGIFRAILRFIDLCEARRIEATVDSNFAEGHRLLRMLGFEREGRMRAYLMDGRDCDLYARVRG